MRFAPPSFDTGVRMMCEHLSKRTVNQAVLLQIPPPPPWPRPREELVLPDVSDDELPYIPAAIREADELWEAEKAKKREEEAKKKEEEAKKTGEVTEEKGDEPVALDDLEDMDIE